MNQEIIQQISWQDVSGNRYSRTIHPAMFSERGYQKLATIRRTGDVCKLVYRIKYDREYALDWLNRKVCVALRPFDLDEIIDCVSEAYHFTSTL